MAVIAMKFGGTSVADLPNAEIDLHVHYYRRFPSSARLWMGGRSSPTVTKHVRARMRRLAGRLHTMLVSAGLIPADTDPRTMLVAIEMADRVLELSFRDTAEAAAEGCENSTAAEGCENSIADFDQDILDIGRRALIAFASDLSRRPPT
jgi:hypothetical protein